MLSHLLPTIFKRKSTRNYLPAPLTDAQLKDIRTFIAQLTPLDPALPYQADILTADQVRSIQPWRAPHYVSVSTLDTPEALRNVGFLFQQLDLYLQSQNLACCWVGLGRPRQQAPEGMTHAILLAFGTPAESALRDGPEQFNRKSLSQIADKADPRLEAVRLAPSAVNSQPWYFTHEGDRLHVYQVEQGPLKRMTVGRMNHIDMGIGLCHLAIGLGDGFGLTHQEDAPMVEGYTYIGTVNG